MELTHILGNTWAIEADELIPFYKLDDRHIILLDTGLEEERDGLEQTFAENGLTPVGVLCSHAHVDHCANSGYFQQKYHIPVALTAPEAGMCSSLLTLKCYFLTLPASEVEKVGGAMIHTPDVIIPAEDGPFPFQGAEFHIIHTPGHSAGHICTVTPDGVLYAADSMLSWEFLNAKLPYNLSHDMAIASREKLRHVDCKKCILAHRGIFDPKETGDLIDANNDLLERRISEIQALIDRPMTISDIDREVCGLYQLFTKRPLRALRFERNIRFLAEYLVDHGRLEIKCKGGVGYYVPVGWDKPVKE